MNDLLIIICIISVAAIVVLILRNRFSNFADFTDRCVNKIHRQIFKEFKFDERIQELENTIQESNNNMDEKFYNPVEERILHALQKMQCNIQKSEEGTILFEYQGEWFVIYTSKDNLWIIMRDANWYVVPLNDIDELAIVRRTVNDVNWNTTCTFVYRIDEEDQKLYLDMLYRCIIFPEIPDIEALLKSLFAIFFTEKRFFMTQLEEERNKEKK